MLLKRVSKRAIRAQNIEKEVYFIVKTSESEQNYGFKVHPQSFFVGVGFMSAVIITVRILEFCFIK